MGVLRATRGRTSVRVRSARAAVGAVSVALLLTACQGQPGAAAFVGSDRIPDSTVSEWVRSVIGDLPEQASSIDAPDFSRRVLSVLIREPLLEETAARLDVDVSQKAIDDAMRPVIEQAGGRAAYEETLAQNGVPAEHVLTWVRIDGMQRLISDAVVADVVVPEELLRQVWTSDPSLSSLPFEEVEDDIRRDLLSERSGELLLAEIQRTADEVGVDVSPRYGAFDDASLQVTAAQPGTVRSPAPSAPGPPGFPTQ